MNAPVENQPLHRFACNFAPHRVETGQHDRVGRVVDEHRDPRGRFEGADIAPFAADDPPFDVVTLQRHCGRGCFKSVFACVPLDGQTDQATGLIFRLQLGFLQNVPRQIRRVPQRFLFNFFQEQPAGLGFAQMGKFLELFLPEFGQPDQFVPLGLDRGLLIPQLLQIIAQILFPLGQTLQLAIDQRFALGQTLFEVGEFAAACAEGLFRLLP